MSYPAQTNSTLPSQLDLPKSEIHAHVQKMCQQGDDCAFRSDHQQAIEYYTQAIALNPNFDLAYCARAKSLIEIKDYRQAETDYQAALKINPTLAIADGGLAQVYYRQKDYAAALVSSDRAIKRDRTNIDFYQCRALINKKLKDYPRILLDCKFILEHQPSDLAARWLNARTHFEMGNYQLAIFNFSQYLNLRSDYAHAHYIGVFVPSDWEIDRKH